MGSLRFSLRLGFGLRSSLGLSLGMSAGFRDSFRLLGYALRLRRRSRVQFRDSGTDSAMQLKLV